MGDLAGDAGRPSAARQPVTAYSPPDPELRAFDRGVGTLRVSGELTGHLACLVGRMEFPPGRVWPWFVIVWADGTKESSFEDFGPLWLSVRELDAGYLQHYGPSKITEKRFLGMRNRSATPGAPCRFDFEWLPRAEAEAQWRRLGLVDVDF